MIPHTAQSPSWQEYPGGQSVQGSPRSYISPPDDKVLTGLSDLLLTLHVPGYGIVTHHQGLVVALTLHVHGEGHVPPCFHVFPTI